MMPSLTVRAVPIRPIMSGAAESWLISPSKTQFDTAPLPLTTQISPMTSVEGSVGITTVNGSPSAILKTVLLLPGWVPASLQCTSFPLSHVSALPVFWFHFAACQMVTSKPASGESVEIWGATRSETRASAGGGRRREERGEREWRTAGGVPTVCRAPLVSDSSVSALGGFLNALCWAA